MTFRSGAAGFFDLCHDGGTGNFGGFRSSCTNNLVVAGGVLAAPDYTRTCTCSYQNQTSIALVPTPDAEKWTFYGKSKLEKVVQQRRHQPRRPRRPPGRGRHVVAGVPEHGRGVAGRPGDRQRVEGRVLPPPPVERDRRAAVGGVVGRPRGRVGGDQALAGRAPDRDYTVRLYFAEPEDLKPGDRVFGVTVQGRRMLDDFDIVKEAGRPHKGIVKEFRGVRVNDELRLSFHPTGKRPAVLCGVEVVAE